MIAVIQQQDLDLWEAWVDFQFPGRTLCGTLYLIGDVLMNSQFVQPYFVKKKAPLEDPRSLVLELVSGAVTDEAYVTEIMYSEELQKIDQYERIKIYSGNNLIKTIREIEKVY